MTPREQLINLEKEDKYVFHGSTRAGLKELNPSQAYHYLNSTERIEDGPPGVAASPYADIAIFRAILSIGRSGWESDGEGNIEFHSEQKVMDKAKDNKGFVYVLDKKDFHPKTGHLKETDWRSEKSAAPVYEIEVTYKDLPSNIAFN